VKGLEGRNVIITGGTSGIGQAIAVRIAADGAHMTINYRRHPEKAVETDEMVREALEECVRGIQKHGVNHIIVQADLTCKMVKSHIPMRRAGTAEEMATIIAYLCSEDAANVTGQTLFVDGGLTLYCGFRTPWSSE